MGKWYETQPARIPEPLFVTQAGAIVDRQSVRSFASMCRGYVAMKGKGIREQLEFVGLLDEFEKGSTPFQLSASIW